MTEEQHQRVSHIVDTLLAVDSEQWPVLLDAIFPKKDSDSVVRAAIEQLLQGDNAVLESKLAALAQPDPDDDSTLGFGVTGSTELQLASGERGVVGRYHLRSLLGEGGMGQVYMAEQRRPIQRVVAIKLIKTGYDTAEVVARFEAERQSLAQMDHPNIARVLDAGKTESGRPYFVMEYVPGAPITTFADERRLNLRKRLDLFLKVCKAVEHAHTKGIIHRDLKPSNILAWIDDEKQQRVKVIDFGIAKALAQGSSQVALTRMPGAVLGTYEYMSPEQLNGSSDIDTRSDVYSLGVLLYELLTGLRPFELKELQLRGDENMRRMIGAYEPQRPSVRFGTRSRAAASPTAYQIAHRRDTQPDTLVRVLKKELEWIPLKAMRKEPVRRYGSVTQLHADVSNYLEGRPLMAGPESRSYQIRKFIGRHRLALAVASLFLLVLVGGVIGTSLGLVRATKAGTAANLAAYRSAIVAAEVACEVKNADQLRTALDSAPAHLRDWEWRWLDGVRRGTEGIVLQAREGERFGDAIPLPDNKRAWSTTIDKGLAVLWDTTSGAVLRRERGKSFAFDPTGERIAIVRTSGDLELCSVDDGRVVLNLQPIAGGRPWQLQPEAFSLDGSHILAMGPAGNALALIDAVTGNIRTVAVPSEPLEALGFFDLNRDSPLGSMVFAMLDQRVFALDANTGEARALSFFKWAGRRPIELSPSTRRGDDSMSCNGDMVLISPDLIYKSVTNYLPKRHFFAFGRQDGTVVFFPAHPPETAQLYLAPEEAIRVIAGPSPINDIKPLPDEQRLIVVFNNGQHHVISIDPPRAEIARMDSVEASAVSPDHTSIAAATWGGLRVVDAITGMTRWARNLGPYSCYCVAWSPDGRKLAVSSDMGQGPSDVFVLDAADGKQIAAWSRSPVVPDAAHPQAPPDWAGLIGSMAFKPDGKELWVGRVNGSLGRIDTSTWKLTADAPTYSPSPARCEAYADEFCRGEIEFSPDGSLVAQLSAPTSALKEQITRLFVVRNATSGKVLWEFSRENYGPCGVTWSPDGTALALSLARADSALVLLLASGTGEVIKEAPIPGGMPAYALSFRSNGERLAVLGAFSTFSLFYTQDWRPIVTAKLPTRARCGAFTSDDALIATSRDYALVRFDADAEQSLPKVLQNWPADLPRPESVRQARAWVAAAQSKIIAAHSDGFHPAESVDPKSLPPEAYALMKSVSNRWQPSINGLNSVGITMTSLDDPERLARGERCLRWATELKPSSSVLWSNYGRILFRMKRYADCIATLETANRLKIERGDPSLLENEIQLAIAEKHVGKPEADAQYDRVLNRLKEVSEAEQWEARDLIGAARDLFGR